MCSCERTKLLVGSLTAFVSRTTLDAAFVAAALALLLLRAAAVGGSGVEKEKREERRVRGVDHRVGLRNLNDVHTLLILNGGGENRE